MTNATLKLHREILDAERQDLLQSFLALRLDCILSGGTALALQLQHRQSFDFDFFYLKEIPATLLTKISQKIKISTVARNDADELTVMDSNDIKVSFIYYPFKSHFATITENGLTVFDYRDIASQKAYTIGRRGTYRDYFDLYCLISGGHITLKEIITNAKTMFGTVFNAKLLLEQLVYFADITNYEIISPADNTIPDPEEVKTFLAAEVKKLL